MGRQKYPRIEKQVLIDTYKQEGSHEKAASKLGLSKTSFRQQYLKSINKCINCKVEHKQEGYYCNNCLQSNRKKMPKHKKCIGCKKSYHREKEQSIQSWSKKRYCNNCIRLRNHELYLKNKDKYRENAKHSLKEDINRRTRYLEYQSKYRKSKKGKLLRRKHNAMRRAMKRTTSDKLINDWVEFLLTNQKIIGCRYCGSIEDITIEHIEPLSRGGTHTINNVDIACSRCNRQKCNKTELEYLKYLLEI